MFHPGCRHRFSSLLYPIAIDLRTSLSIFVSCYRSELEEPFHVLKTANCCQSQYRCAKRTARALKSITILQVELDCSQSMASSGSSMLYSFLLFIVILSLQEMYRGKLASTELFTIFGGFTSSLLFLVLLTFIGNYQETSGIKTGWGAVILAEAVALIAAATVHRVCITTCFLFSAALLYEVNKLSGMTLSKSESKTRRF